MADVHSAQVRSFNMSRIKGKNTKPELLVRKFLYANGFRYRIHVKALPGQPDIVIRRLKTIVDVRGCFWHKHSNCRWGSKVKSRSKTITERVMSAVHRDKLNHKKWQQLGWNVIVVWDSCELEAKKKNSERRDKTLEKLLVTLRQIERGLPK